MRSSVLAQTYRRFHKYLANSTWIIAEKVLGLGLAFIGTVLVARHLGPDNFGSLAYAFSLAALFGAAGHMGLHGLAIRDIISLPKLRAETLGTTTALKLMGAVVGYIALLAYAMVFEGRGTPEFSLIVIAGAVLLFQPFNVIGFWFEAFLQARYTAIARVSASLVAVALKVGLIFASAGLVYFAVAQALQPALAAGFLFALYYTTATLRPSQWRFRRSRAYELLSQGWVIYLGSIFAVIYLKVDQVMLRWLTDTAELGQYAIAAQMSEVWYFVPTAIVASFFPRMIWLRQQDEARFYRRLQQLFDVLFMTGLTVAITVTAVAPWLVTGLFGAEYAASASILVVHIWAALFVFMRSAFSKWILIENALYFSMFTQGLGAASNVVLNYLLIPELGGVGAAYATLASYAVASFLSLSLNRRTRPVFWQMCLSLLAPVRYPLTVLRRHR
jgi:O-antigen/teichoic acid export membrane protein